MENYSLLMGAAAVMKMAVEMAAVSMEKPSGGTSPFRRRAGTETPVPQILASRWRRLWKVSMGFVEHIRVFATEALNRRKGGVRGLLGGPHYRGARPPPWPRWPRVWWPWAPSLAFLVCSGCFRAK